MSYGDFRWLFPGEGAIAAWAEGRVQKVQGDSRDLVAGAYVVLASLWGSLGGLLVLSGIVIDWNGNTGPGLIVGLVGIALLSIGSVRLTQSRRARHKEGREG